MSDAALRRAFIALFALALLGLVLAFCGQAHASCCRRADGSCFTYAGTCGAWGACPTSGCPVVTPTPTPRPTATPTPTPRPTATPTPAPTPSPTPTPTPGQTTLKFTFNDVQWDGAGHPIVCGYAVVVELCNSLGTCTPVDVRRSQ